MWETVNNSFAILRI